MWTKEEIGRIIKESRLSAGLTQKQVAEFLNRPQQTIASWETGKSQPDANTLFVLFQILDRPLDEAFGFSKSKKEKPPAQGGELNKEETALIELFRRVPPEQRTAMLQAIEMTLRSQGLL